jgi:putative transposase
MKDGLLNGEIFDTLTKAKVLIERCRAYHNSIRPHSSLSYISNAPEVRFVDIDLQMA